MMKYHAYYGSKIAHTMPGLDCIDGDWLTSSEIYMWDKVNGAEEWQIKLT